MRIAKHLYIVAISMSILSCQKTAEAVVISEVSAKTMLNVSYGSNSKQQMDIYLPANRSNKTKAMVLIHGGGWNSGDKSNLNSAVDIVKKLFPGWAIFNINYRLASGANLFPAQENDVNSAMQFIVDNAADYLISNDFVLMGVSAGAHLGLLQGYKYESQIKPKAIVSFFGPTDLYEMYVRPKNPFIPNGLVSVIGKTPSQDSLLYANSSPINFVTANSAPTLLLHGGLDPIVSVSQATMLKAKLNASGVPNQYVLYPSEGHGWFGINLFDSFNKIQAFLNEHVQ